MQKLTRWGNSVGCRIPAPVLEAAGLRAGAYVHVRLLDSGEIRLKPVENIEPAQADAASPPKVYTEETW